MQEKDDKGEQKHPTEMTTEEAIDYVFAPEIAEALRREAGTLCGQIDEREEPEAGDKQV